MQITRTDFTIFAISVFVPKARYYTVVSDTVNFAKSMTSSASNFSYSWLKFRIPLLVAELDRN